MTRTIRGNIRIDDPEGHLFKNLIEQYDTYIISIMMGDKKRFFRFHKDDITEQVNGEVIISKMTDITPPDVPVEDIEPPYTIGSCSFSMDVTSDE